MTLLTTTGAKSGQARTSPVVYTKDGDRYVIIASKAGAPTNPDWFHNLVAQPRGDPGGGHGDVPGSGHRHERRGAGRGSTTRRGVLMPGFAEYAQKTTREIPVVVLERLA